MNLKMKIGLVGASVFVIAILGSWAWSSHKTATLERAVESAKARADAKTKAADEMEKQSAVYAAKTGYLEQKLAEIQAIARKQDEQLEKINVDTNAARTSAGRARSVRAIASTADDLCAKLAEVGHGCQ
ncbi:MAG: hypothetical protein ABI878_06255 [Acidobacteriota bacterium]